MNAATANVFCAVEPLAGRLTRGPPPIARTQFALILARLPRRLRTSRTIPCSAASYACRRALTRQLVEAGGALWKRFTIHFTPNTPVGSIKPRLRLASLPGNAWARGVSLPYSSCVPSARLGIALSTASGSKSIGPSPVSTPLTCSINSSNYLTGRGTRSFLLLALRETPDEIPLLAGVHTRRPSVSLENRQSFRAGRRCEDQHAGPLVKCNTLVVCRPEY